MRLLSRTVCSFIIYAGLLLLTAIPIFYFVLNRLVIQEIDQVLLSHKYDFTKAAVKFRSLEDIQHYPLLNEEFFVTPAKELITTDSFYSEFIVKPNAKEPIPFRVVRTGMMINGEPFELLVKESLLESKDLIRAIVSTQSVLIAVLLAGLILINRNLSKRLWHPYYTMVQKLKKYDIHNDKPLNLDHSDIIEFEDLRNVIHQLTQHTHQAYISQKEFTENASHEIQTPLAVAASKLDLLMQTDELTSRQAELIGEVSDATHQLSRLNRSLLLLSKMENTQFHEIVTISMRAIVTEVIHQLQDMAQEKQIHLDAHLNDFSITANHAQTEILMINLLGNAIRHSGKKSTVTIKVNGYSLLISNPGKPLNHPGKIFERFQRDVASSTGSGLGLAIVATICKTNHYSLRYEYEEAHHHFQVVFK